MRTGECDRCGVCCKIVFNCPFLSEKGGHTTCLIYKYRPIQCRAFPLNEHDLMDIEYKCSYRFKNTNGS
ncbi:MAG: YkgJ family cysteine cluster protein [bacterium]